MDARKDISDTAARPGRNEPCHCGSGRKYKQCCLDKDETAARAAREKIAAEAPPPGPSDAPAAKPQKPQSYQPWKRSATNTHGFHRMSTPRKVGGS
jgi:hypothetical protein